MQTLPLLAVDWDQVIVTFSRLLWNKVYFSPFPIHRTYFWVSPPQMALLGFFHVNSLFASPVHSRKPEFTGQQALWEREVTWWGKKKKEEEKSPEKKTLHRDRDLNPRTLSPEPSVLSIRPRRPASSGYLRDLLFALLFCETNIT